MSKPQQRTVHRSPKGKSSRFARIDNALLQDSRLSFRARGVLGFVLSKSDLWKHSADRVAQHGKEGVDAIRVALNELKTLGYATQVIGRDEHGRMSSVWVFHEAPAPENPDLVDASPNGENPDPVPSPERPGAGGPSPGGPGSGGPGAGKARPLETKVSVTTVLETTIKETTVGGAAHPSPPVAFPWASVSELPAHLVDKLTSAYRHSDDAKDVFATIRGRELTYRAKHTLSEWADIFVAAVNREDNSDDRNHNGGSFSEARRRKVPGAAWRFADAFNHSTPRSDPTPSAPPYAGPEGWQEFLRKDRPNTAYSPGGAKYTTSWDELPRDAQSWLKEEMEKPFD